MTASPTVSTPPTTVAGVLPGTARQPQPQGRAPATAAPPPTGAVLNLRTTASRGRQQQPSPVWCPPTQATFEAWIRTAVKAERTTVIGANGDDPAPRIAVGAEQLSLYWNESGAAVRRRGGRPRRRRSARCGRSDVHTPDPPTPRRPG